MKRLSILFAFCAYLIAGTMNMQAANTDEQGHTLVSLWKTYDQALKADKPKSQVTALEEIKKAASSQKLPWDFFDAARKTVDSRVRSNWKVSAQAKEEYRKEVMDSGDPMVILAYHLDRSDRDAASEFVKSNKERLSKGHNTVFYDKFGLTNLQYCKALLPLIGNDYEFALWELFCLNDGSTSDALADIVKGDYPKEAFMRFTNACRLQYAERKDALKALVGEYEGKAAALLPEQQLLSMEFNDLNSDEKTTSDQFKAFREKCAGFVTRRDRFKGSEAVIAQSCKSVENLIETLDSKEISCDVKNGNVTIMLRNLSKVQLQVIKEKKPVWNITLFNKDNSFYAWDEVKTSIPETLEDGEYEIRCSNGKVVEERPYTKATLSIAQKRDSKGHAVYVADYMSGEPVGSCILELVDNSDNVVASAPVKFDGYAYLPDSFSKFVSNRKARLSVRAVCSEGKAVRRSRTISLDRYYYEEEAVEPDAENLNAILLTDRSAFNPGEKINFKVILFEGRYEYKTSASGKTVTVALYDTDDNEVERRYLAVNEFGSAAGEFELKNVKRGGMFTLKVLDGDDDILSYRMVRVDEFVLPSFELKWDKSDRFYLPGETISVSGDVKAYSGHNLSGARMEYTVKRYWNDIKKGSLNVGENGHFEITFPAGEENWSYYTVEARITDGTGEVLEFETTAYSGKDIPLDVVLKNSSKGRCNLAAPGRNMATAILGDDVARVGIDVNDGGSVQLNHPTLKIRYELRQGKKTIKSGKASPGDVLELDMAGMPSGLYEFWAEASAKTGKQDYAAERSLMLIKVGDEDESLDFDAGCFFKEIPGEDIALQIGATDGPTWAVVELYGSGNVLLEHQIVYLTGAKGENGSVKTIRYKYKNTYPNTVSLRVLWFKNASGSTYSMDVHHLDFKSALPLSFTRFLDTTAPGLEYSFSIKTEAGVECAATIFDASSETVMPNVWNTVRAQNRPEPTLSYNTCYGMNSTGYNYLMTKGAPMKARSMNAMVMEEEALSLDMLDETVVVGYGMNTSMEAAADEEASLEAIREDFAATVAWAPFLRSDKDGVIDFTFTTSDKLSRYYVQLFAHDKDMRNAALRQEMTITLPVKVAVVEPRHLFKGDRYVVNVTVSNSIAKKINGKLTAKFIEGKDYKAGKKIQSKTVRLSVPANGNASASFELKNVGDIADLGLLVGFEADDRSYGSDAVFVTVPVKVPEQTVTESHSAILMAGADAVELENMLRSEFINMDGKDAAVREISIRQMLGEALPENIEPEADNVLALTDALYARYLLNALTGRSFDNSEIESKIQACRNSDGGFGWFEGMHSSSIVTAVVLERFAGMKKSFDGMKEAVLYMDAAQFGTRKTPYWCGGISDAKYMYVRAMYAQVPFNTKDIDSKVLRDFRKNAKEYLVPSEERGLEGRILDKARRLLTLRMLMSSAKGESLARDWSVSSVSKLAASVKADIESLYEYAEPHKCGGFYYPNAVMPFRGLLESELYAHSLLCELLSSTERKDIADGIRLWMMIQKETQQWQSDPAYIQALNSVFRGSREVLATKVLALSATATLPFEEIKASGNGFTLERKYSVCREDGKWEGLSDGEVLKLGDKVRADYCIWNEENRSFVRLSVPRPACLMPEDQLSGHFGWWMNPLRADGWYVFSPQGYRTVRADMTEYWFDSYPEEKTTISEVFFVTQEGSFQSGVPVIESLYAPHYRANADGTGPVTAVHE